LRCWRCDFLIWLLVAAVSVAAPVAEPDAVIAVSCCLQTTLIAGWAWTHHSLGTGTTNFASRLRSVLLHLSFASQRETITTQTSLERLIIPHQSLSQEDFLSHSASHWKDTRLFGSLFVSCLLLAFPTHSSDQLPVLRYLFRRCRTYIWSCSYILFCFRPFFGVSYPLLFAGSLLPLQQIFYCIIVSWMDFEINWKPKQSLYL
jgi:hypothetical protein